MSDQDNARGREFAEASKKFLKASMANPMDAVRSYMDFGQQMYGALSGSSDLQPAKDDKRFMDPLWSSNPAYRTLLQSYLAWCQGSMNWVDGLDMEPRDKDRAKLLMATVLDTFSPTNSILGNPTAMKKTMETGGKNIVSGLQNMMDDIVNNDGMPSMVDRSAFKVGENLALSPGKVVYREDMLELIQYSAKTDKVHGTPILIVPPQINKFYVWDLAPGRSIIEYLVEQGFTVFIVSWRNPTAKDAENGMSYYVDALDRTSEVVCDISKSKQVHIAGACSGGLTTAMLLGYWAAKGIDRVKSATLLVTILDTEGAADTSIGLFANLNTLALAKKISKTKGIVQGSDLAKVFAWLRPNDLIWAYYVNNYLLGQDPPAFDLLFWNDDTTELSGKFHTDLMDLIETNSLTTPGATEMLGEAIDLTKVTSDVYMVGGTTDHITPWEGCYRSIGLLGGKVDYVLSASGHVQAIVNPPSNKKAKFKYMAGAPESVDSFLEAAEDHQGTWWVHWADWLKERSAAEKTAPKSAGNKEHPPIGDAPGTYI